MGSEGPIEAVRFNVTGFGKFHGVADNPTQTLVSKLNSRVKEEGGPPIQLEVRSMIGVWRSQSSNHHRLVV